MQEEYCSSQHPVLFRHRRRSLNTHNKILRYTRNLFSFNRLIQRHQIIFRFLIMIINRFKQNYRSFSNRFSIQSLFQLKIVKIPGTSIHIQPNHIHSIFFKSMNIFFFLKDLKIESKA